MVNTQNFERWLTTLESDEFDQATGALTREAAWWEDGDLEDKEIFWSLYGNRVEPIGFCCLGVAECVRTNGKGIQKWGGAGLASRRTLEWLGIPLLHPEEAPPLAKDDNQYDLVVVDSRGQKTHTKSAAQRNDAGQSFAEIALWLSENRDRLRGEDRG